MALTTEQLKQQSRNNLYEAINATKAQVLRPPPKMSLSQWADTYRMLSSEASAEPGRWKTDRAPYQREMLDTVSDPKYEQIVFATSAQVGKTEILLNLLLYFVHYDPCPILLVQPTKELAGSFSKDRLSPAIRDTKVVTNLIADAKSRDSGNTILAKSFPGGVLNIVGSNAPSSLASRPCRIVLADEVDRFPPSAGTEGSPLALAWKRANNFFNRKLVSVSTPTDKGTSVIWSLYEQSDQRKYHVRCFYCKDYFIPVWEHIKWEKDANNHYIEGSAYMECPHCGGRHTDTQRHNAVRNGKWVAENPSSKIAGFHLTALISPWSELDKLVAEWLACIKDVQRLKTFFNTVLGLPWEDKNDNVDEVDFLSRCEEYEVSALPNKIQLITAGCDVQDDRIEISVYGWGEQNESWHIEHSVVHGNPANPKVWADLATQLRTVYKREDGLQLKIQAACIDSGGHFTQEVYSFCKRYSQHRWFAVKGRAGNYPIFPHRASYTKQDKKVYVLGVDSAKEAVYGWLKNTTAGPGYIHFSTRCDADFFSQISAERKVLTYKNGYTFYVWKKDPNRRNEVLDCLCYALAAREGLNLNLTRLKKINAGKVNQKEEQESKVEIKNEDDVIEQNKSSSPEVSINKNVEAPTTNKKLPKKWVPQIKKGWMSL